MKKLLATAAVLSALTATQSQAMPANSFPYWYIGLGGGATFQQDSDVDGSSSDLSWDTGYVASASLGYQPPHLGGFRIEGEYTFRQQDIDGSGNNNNDSLRVSVAAANLYYDFHNTTQITPYIGGGIGYGWFHLEDAPGLGDGGNSERVIYQGMLGLGYEPPSIPNVGLTLGYRYLAPFNEPRAHNTDYDFDNHSVEVGAKFRF